MTSRIGAQHRPVTDHQALPAGVCPRGALVVKDPGCERSPRPDSVPEFRQAFIRDIELDVENSGTIPIVMTAVDPVGTHVVASLARPGGNVTGAVALISEL